MKLFSKTFFFCFFFVLFLFFLDSIFAAKFRLNENDSGTLGGNVRDIRSSDAMLLSDENEHGTQFGEDVILSGYGPINLTLTYEVLEFEVCKSCMGTSTVCYEASIGLGDSKAVGDCRGSSSCEFKVNGIDNKIFFGEGTIFKFRFVYYCDSTTKMQYPFTDFLSRAYFESCEPKMDDNKMIKLFVDIDPECSIKVKNARIYVPKVTLTESPSKHTSKDSSEASFPIWGYIIIIVGIVVLIVILIIGFIAYRIYKKRQTSKRIPPNIDEIKSKPTVSNAKIETPTNQNLKLAKVEPKMNNENKSIKNQKKDKKKKTKIQEPTTTEEIPTISQQESVPVHLSKQLPPPNPAACLPEVKRIIPRSMKSANTDSLDETLKKDKSVMMESESVKF